MSRFPTAGHLCSWAKFSPGITSSGGKIKGNGSTGHGNRYLARGARGDARVARGDARGSCDILDRDSGHVVAHLLRRVRLRPTPEMPSFGAATVYRSTADHDIAYRRQPL
ncbi:transposase [Pseudarthrobacter sp. NIBRBAC000502772]|uniref:transposase n=1 Tax=Pseudarthrobacter sp. NIBRBAC000502772 TaxID=2590775 RepID=UPI001FED5ED6|nr:transposase [Pseudarthrobacter sp. NIBRBAC000502772]